MAQYFSLFTPGGNFCFLAQPLGLSLLFLSPFSSGAAHFPRASTSTSNFSSCSVIFSTFFETEYRMRKKTKQKIPSGSKWGISQRKQLQSFCCCCYWQLETKYLSLHCLPFPLWYLKSNFQFSLAPQWAPLIYSLTFATCSLSFGYFVGFFFLSPFPTLLLPPF